MTDQTQIAVIENQLAGLSAGQLTLTDVESSLSELWNQAEAAQDTRAMTLINTAWANAQALAAATEQAAAIAVTAVEVANEMVNQRNVIADELGNLANSHQSLVKAMKNVDTDNPLVMEVYEAAEEMVYEYVQQGMQDGIHTDTPGMDICENGHLGDGVTEEMADEFLDIVMGYSDNLPDELLEELSSFIQDYTTRAIDWWQQDRARRIVEQQTRRTLVQYEAGANG